MRCFHDSGSVQSFSKGTSEGPHCDGGHDMKKGWLQRGMQVSLCLQGHVGRCIMLLKRCSATLLKMHDCCR